MMDELYPDRGPGTSVRVESGSFISTGVVNVAETSTLIVQKNGSRYGVCLCNDGPETVYLGTRAGVSIANGFSLHVGATISFGTYAELYGVSAGGTGIVRYIEEAR